MKKTRIQSILAGLVRPIFPALVIACACGLLGTLSGNREIRLSGFGCLYLLSLLFCFLFSRKHHAVFFVCGTLGFVFAAYRLRTILGGEACLFVAHYLEYLNPYYHQSLMLLEPWSLLAAKAGGMEEITAYLAILGLWTGCAFFARRGRIGVCGLWLIASAAAGMAVGLAPEGIFLPLGLAALMSWLLIRRSGSIPLSALIFMLAGVLALAAVPFADRIPTESLKLSIQDALESAVFRIRLLVTGETATTGVGGGDLGQAGELAPDDSEALTVRMDDKPEQAVYLAAYTGSIYENNCWEPVSESEWSLEEVGVLYAENWMSGGRSQMSVAIRDADARFLAHPYASIIPGSLENFVGDAYIGIQETQSDYTFQVPRLLLSGTADEWQSLSDSLEDTYDTYQNFVDEHNGDLQGEEWDSLRTWLLCRLPEEDFSDVEKAQWVRELLAQTADYSLSPGTAPAGENVVVWFLTEKQEGFCMHFASAGAALLRMWGVTARYAEGYLVNPSDFRQTEDGDWEAVVTNTSAHAWTEIFLPGLGWIPMEMTPGFGEESGSSLQETGGQTETTTETGEATAETENTEIISENGTEDSAGRQNGDLGTNDASASENGEKGTGTISTVAKAGTGTETGNSGGRVFLFRLIGMVLVVPAAVIYVRRSRARSLSRPRRFPNSQSAVLKLGREILSCCIRRGMPASLTFTSPDFPEAASGFLTEEELARLKETKDIVNRAEFGYNQVEEEDCRKVWECFRLFSKEKQESAFPSSKTKDEERI